MNLRAGLAVHCGSCAIVVPADAPRPAAGADCAFVARNKLAPWHPNETIKGQHTAATAAWRLIYHAALEGPSPDAASVAYWQQYVKDPKKHFTGSAARLALTPEHIAEQQAHPKAARDAHFYA